MICRSITLSAALLLAYAGPLAAQQKSTEDMEAAEPADMDRGDEKDAGPEGAGGAGEPDAGPDPQAAGEDDGGSTGPELDFRLRQAIDASEGAGFVVEGQQRFFLTSAGQTEQLSVVLTKGVEYEILAACGAGCKGVDFPGANGGLKAVTGDGEQAGVGRARLKAKVAGEVVVKLAARECRNVLCSMQATLLKREPGASQEDKGAPGGKAELAPPATSVDERGMRADPASGASPSTAAPAQSKPGPSAQTGPVAEAAKPAVIAATPLAGAPAKPADGSKSGSFTIFANRSITGSDIEVIKGSTQELCAAACDKNPKCIGYSFDKWNMVCFPKHTAGALIFTARSVTALKPGGQEARLSKLPFGMELYRSKRFPNAQGDGQNAASAEACRDLCRKDEKCAAFSFMKTSKACHLLPEADVYVADAEWDSGAKLQQAAQPAPPKPKPPAAAPATPQL